MTSIYKKLTPTKRAFFGYTQLWLAPDHILLLSSSQLAEDYKRFAFTDIQSIVVTELPSRLVPQIIMVLAALAWSGLWFAVDIPFFKWFFVITGALALALAIRDIARGARCRCYLHTRVSRERLVPVSRMKIAAKFLATVRPLSWVEPPRLGRTRVRSSIGPASMKGPTMRRPLVPGDGGPSRARSVGRTLLR
jgi:hypothetical protein